MIFDRHVESSGCRFPKNSKDVLRDGSGEVDSAARNMSTWSVLFPCHHSRSSHFQ